MLYEVITVAAQDQLVARGMGHLVAGEFAATLLRIQVGVATPQGQVGERLRPPEQFALHPLMTGFPQVDEVGRTGAVFDLIGVVDAEQTQAQAQGLSYNFV